MLRQLVILIDAFEDNRLPFHLEFINSVEALLAVLEVRFKERGEFALSKIRQRMFNLYDLTSQKRIHLRGPWAQAFLVGAI
ncbi:hypothetical protein GQ44DRAFT_702688 [Phaeosphaeriaceae sp. PMI808]|nr:hypothetical protein GQ44DRAFT_702688 [Phaeosphaeriaceae sp. PMI808]